MALPDNTNLTDPDLESMSNDSLRYVFRAVVCGQYCSAERHGTALTSGRPMKYVKLDAGTSKEFQIDVPRNQALEFHSQC